MKIEDIVKILDGKMINGNEKLKHEIETGFASDLMSDVLTLQAENMVLITGLANVQTIRTAEMADIDCIVFARKKKASPDIIYLAKENNIAIIECSYSMFKTCGLLFSAGLKPVY
jgi:predicted transcriptional regulator